MIPRKKEPQRTDRITPPVEDECENCTVTEGDCCPEAFVSEDDKKTTTR